MRGKKKEPNQDEVMEIIAVSNRLLSHLHDTLNFLYPELSNEEVLEKFIFVLSPLVNPDLLLKGVEFFNELGQQKLEEVTDLYAQFNNEEEAPNNN